MINYKFISITRCRRFRPISDGTIISKEWWDIASVEANSSICLYQRPTETLKSARSNVWNLSSRVKGSKKIILILWWFDPKCHMKLVNSYMERRRRSYHVRGHITFLDKTILAKMLKQNEYYSEKCNGILSVLHVEWARNSSRSKYSQVRILFRCKTLLQKLYELVVLQRMYFLVYKGIRRYDKAHWIFIGYARYQDTHSKRIIL